MMFLKTSLFGGAILFVGTSFGQAVNSQESKQSSSSDSKQEVEVRGDTAKSIEKNSSAAKRVFTAETLNQFGDVSFLSSLKRLPSIVIIGDKPSLAGLDGKYTQILIDGDHRRTDSIGDLPLSLVERVEIYHAGAVEFSSQAIGGTINIVLKKIPKTKKSTFRADYSESQTHRTSSEIAISDTVDNFSYSILVRGTSKTPKFAESRIDNVSYSNFETTLKGPETIIENKNSSSKQLQVRTKMQFSAPNSLNVSVTPVLTSTESEYRDQSEYLLPTVAEFRSNDRSFNKTNSLSATIDLKLPLSEDWQMSGKFVTSEKRIEGKSFGEISKTKTSLTEELASTSLSSIKSYSTSGKFYYSGLSNFFKGHELVFGWDADHWEDAESGENIRKFKGELGSQSGTVREITSSALLSFFAQDEIKINKANEVYIGARFEHTKQHYFADPNVDFPVARSSSEVFKNASPIFHYLYKINESNIDSLRFSFSQAYSLPNTNAAPTLGFMQINNSVYNPVLAFNYKLRPEIGRTYQTSYEHNGDDGLNYNFRYSFKKIDDLLVRSLFANNGNWFFETVNSGRGISRVLDFDAQFPISLLLQGAPQIDIGLSISKNWSSKSTLPPPTNRLSPSTLLIKIMATYQSREQPLRLGVSGTYQDSVLMQIDDRSTKLGSSTPDIDMFATWSFDSKTNLRLSLSNLLKKVRRENTTYMLSSENIYHQRFSPTYRSVGINFEHKF